MTTKGVIAIANAGLLLHFRVMAPPFISSVRNILVLLRKWKSVGWVSYSYFMATRKLRQTDKQFNEKLGKRIGKIILGERGYSSLDAFSLEHHDKLSKPFLYHLVKGKRDAKISSLRRLAEALGVNLEELFRGL